MGNRACIQFVDSNTPAGVTVYLHWHGGDVRQWLNEAAPNMRAGDSSYAAARFIAHCAEKMPGGLSLGVLRDPFDPGDNGLFVVDCSAGRVTHFCEGDSGDLARVGRPFSIKLGKF